MENKDKELVSSLPAEVQKLVPKTPRETDYAKAFKRLAFKTVENMASVKFYILVVSTIFFYIGKLSEGVWQETVLIVAGLRAVNEVASMFKKEPAPAESTKGQT